MAQPWIQKCLLHLEAPAEDRTDDVSRCAAALAEAGFPGARLPLPLVQARFPALREAHCTATLVRDAGETVVTDLEPGDTTAHLYGAAVDLGSTTVVLRLMDTVTGETLAETTRRNGQRAYGDEILSRIFYAKDSPERRAELQAVTAETIRALLEEACAAAGLTADDISAMVVSGNTVMTHFLLGLDTFCLFHTPFCPVLSRPGTVEAERLGLGFRGAVYCFPATANYLGGDIISGLLHTGLTQREETSLFLDIGTNGEMVLGNREYLIGGAGAAGPALEGGISASGMRAKEGAVDAVIIENGALRCSVIGGGKPRGICGSGIVDLLAQMLLAGWIDRAGTLQSEKSSRIRTLEGRLVVVYADETESATGKPLYFAQEDIRQFTETKAAAYTMVAVLLDTAGLTLDQVDRIYLAGAFGRHLNLESAITIGLYPDAPREKFRVVGNSSLEGACELLRGGVSPEEADRVAQEIYYLEFAMQETFVEEMRAATFYPHTDLALYPTVAAKL